MREPAYALLGHFCWPELVTPDIEATKRFYGALFRWEAVDLPTPTGAYTVFRVDGLDVAAAHENGSEKVLLPHWNVSVAVENAEDAAAKVVSLGGRVLTRPMDVGGLGRKAFVQDPGGAHFGLWQSQSHFGAGLFGALNTLGWTGLDTWDMKEADAFYGGLFGWESEPEAEDRPTPEVWWLNSTRVGGLRAMSGRFDKSTPCHWMNYFVVKDCVAQARRARAGGGEVLSGPTEILGVGRCSVVRDPAGADFAVISLLKG